MSRHSSPADWFWMQQFDNPPTTAEWLRYCRLSGIRQQYYVRGTSPPRLRRPFRPFISPDILPWGRFTGGGYQTLRGRRLP